MDFIWDFAVPLPILVISELVGIPEGDREHVKRWCDDFSVVALNFYANIESDQLKRGLHSVMESRAYLEAKVDELRRAPRQETTPRRRSRTPRGRRCASGDPGVVEESPQE